MGVRHFEPHMCPDCGLCWCACNDCHQSLTLGCVCEDCPCIDQDGFHDNCPTWQAMMEEQL